MFIIFKAKSFILHFTHITNFNTCIIFFHIMWNRNRRLLIALYDQMITIQFIYLLHRFQILSSMDRFLIPDLSKVFPLIPEFPSTVSWHDPLCLVLTNILIVPRLQLISCILWPPTPVHMIVAMLHFKFLCFMQFLSKTVSGRPSSAEKCSYFL